MSSPLKDFREIEWRSDEIHITKRRSDLNVRVIDAETVALDRRQGLIHQLNQTASYIWEQCDGTLRVGEIAKKLSDTFEVDPETAAKDVAATIREFRKLGLLES